MGGGEWVERVVYVCKSTTVCYKSLNVCDVLKYLAFPVNYHDFYKLLSESGWRWVNVMWQKEYYMLELCKESLHGGGIKRI